VGRNGEAIDCQQESLAISQALGNHLGQAEALLDLGDSLHAVARPVEAHAAWQEALAIYEMLRLPEADEIRARLADLSRETSPPAHSE
jgi:hypothetical protein